MLPFRQILFPVDYSEPCRAIVPYVEDMIRHFSANLTLVHASGLGLEALGYSELNFADAGLQQQSRSMEQKRLRDFAAEMFPSQHVEAIAEEGDPASVIHKVVQHQGADLVMLPTHGRGAVRRFLLGSVTAKLMHDLTTVVWTGVHSAVAEHQPGIPYRSIVCALDKSDEAEGVLRSAAAFADSYGAKLLLVHVVETPPGAWDVDFEPYKKDLMDAAATQPAATTPPPAAGGGGGAVDVAAGKSVFESAGCASCHTLADAGATGAVGPNLDDAKPDAALVKERVTNGKAPMPPFKGQLSEKQIQDVAAYVSSVAGKS